MLFVYDLETTGVMHWKNSIHQLSFQIWVDNEKKAEGDLKVKPHPRAIIEPKALEVGGVTEEQILGYPSQGEVYDELIGVLNRFVDKFDRQNKLHLVGYNNRSFDDQFFRAFFKQCGDPYFGSWFWSDSIDVMVLASYFLRDERKMMENFKLMTVAKHLGIEVIEEELHDALYDLELTKAIFDVITMSYDEIAEKKPKKKK